MKINGVIVDVENQHSVTRSNSPKENYISQNSYNPNSTLDSLTIFHKDELKISTEAMTSLRQEQDQSPKALNKETPESAPSVDDGLKIEILRNLLRQISGKNYNLDLEMQLDPDITIDKLKSLINQAQIKIKNNQSLPKGPLESEILVVETQKENGELIIKAGGVAKTADGKYFDFDIQLNLDQKSTSQNVPIVPASIDAHI
jgi:hypothetical protein